MKKYDIYAENLSAKQVLDTLVRDAIEFHSILSAKNFDENRSDVRNIEKMIVDYVRRVDERELDDLVYELQDIKLKWQDQAVGELYYRKKNKKSLLKPDVNEDDRFRVMNSMRSVEKQSGIYLAEGLSL